MPDDKISKKTNIDHTKTGIIGDGAKVNGGIHLHYSDSDTLKRDIKKTGWIKKWDIFGKKKAIINDINSMIGVNPLEIEKYYIEPDVQNVNPANHDNERSNIGLEPVMKIIDHFFYNDGGFKLGNNQMFIFSDAGMGKSSLLVMLKLMHLKAFWPKRKDCILKKLGKTTLEEVAQIKDKFGTILLLDALDEDSTAYGNVQERLLSILRATKDFFKVIITCRTQFFPKVSDDPMKREGFFQIEEFICPAKYLSFFSDKKVIQYLMRRFPKKFFVITDEKKVGKAQAVINKMGSLSCRPMLLSYVEDLMASPMITTYRNEYHVYDALVKSWLIREKAKMKGTSKKSLLKACIILATIMQIERIRNISEKKLDKMIEKINGVLPIKKIQIKGRSLINRNSEGEYRFSHYSIQEFCVAKLLLEKPVFKPNGQIPVTDFIFRQIVQSEKEPNFIKLLDFESLNLSNLELENLKGLKLPGTKIFKGMDFSSKDLSNCDLNGSDLSNCNFTRSNLGWSDLSKCKLTDANFKNANIKGLSLKDSDCFGANFDGTLRSQIQLRSEMTILDDMDDKVNNQKLVYIKNNFEDKGEVIIDHITGLMWQKSGSNNEQLNIKSGDIYINKLNKARFVGYSDWRLPTIEELTSLLEPKKQNGSHINSIFDSKQNICCSSDIADPRIHQLQKSELIWIINFVSGEVDLISDERGFYVKAVRP